MKMQFHLCDLLSRILRPSVIMRINIRQIAMEDILLNTCPVFPETIKVIKNKMKNYQTKNLRRHDKYM
jgi:hypothetical protein